MVQLDVRARQDPGAVRVREARAGVSRNCGRPPAGPEVGVAVHPGERLAPRGGRGGAAVPHFLAHRPALPQRTDDARDHASCYAGDRDVPDRNIGALDLLPGADPRRGPRMKIRDALAIVLGIAAVLPALGQQDYPNKPIRLITPAAQGGTTDILARIFAAKLSEVFKQQV